MEEEGGGEGDCLGYKMPAPSVAEIPPVPHRQMMGVGFAAGLNLRA